MKKKNAIKLREIFTVKSKYSTPNAKNSSSIPSIPPIVQIFGGGYRLSGNPVKRWPSNLESEEGFTDIQGVQVNIQRLEVVKALYNIQRKSTSFFFMAWKR